MTLRFITCLGIVMACGCPFAISHADSSDTTPAPRAWQFSGALYYYAFPKESDLLNPVVCARYDRLHLEGRYNYEDRNTASIFVGYVFEAGEELYLEVVPIAGLALGNTDGFVPGFELTVALDPLEFYSEGEYLIDLDDSQANFFYLWSELSILLPAGFRAGLAGQRTVLYETEPQINPGILAGFDRDTWGGAFYLFNPGREDSYLMLSLNADF